jgi:hypothetical protein
MLGVFAEFETNLRRERQLEGIAKAKAAGVYKGPSAFNRSVAASRKAQGMRPSDIAEALKIGRGVGVPGAGGGPNCGAEFFGILTSAGAAHLSCRARASRPKSVICIHTTWVAFSSAVTRRPRTNPARKATVNPCRA